MEANSNASEKWPPVPGSPLETSLEDITQAGEEIDARKRHEELSKALAKATGPMLQGEYFDY